MKLRLPVLMTVIVLLATSVNAQQYGWCVIDPPTIPESISLSDLYFIDDTTGWVTTSSYDSIYKTDDGGLTFSAQVTPLGSTPLAIHMLDAQNGYAGGYGGWIYVTSNGGLEWNFISTMGVHVVDISFPPGMTPDNPVGYACGNSGNVWEITDSMTNLNTGLQGDFNGISASSVNNVWACGGNRIYYYNGTDFTSQPGPGGTFNDIHFINDQEGWVVGNGGVIGHTTNGGIYWDCQIEPDSQNMSLYGVFFLNADEGWAVGAEGIILHTSNGGTDWSVEADGLTSSFLRGVHFTSPTNGYVVGNDRTLLKYGLITTNADLAVEPDSMDFGQVIVGSDSSGVLRIKSTGTDTLKISDINSSNGAFSISDTSFSLAPAESTEVTATFSPPASQIYSENFTILHNAKGSTVVPVTGEGIIVIAPDISVWPDSLGFGNVEVGEDSSLTLYVKSIGTDTLKINDINSSAAAFSLSDTAFSLAPEESTEVAVTFTPTDEHSYLETLTLLHNAKGETVVPMTGTGVIDRPQVLSLVLSDPSPCQAGSVDFTFAFDRRMDTSVEPAVSYGLDVPYEDHTITASPGWSTDSTSWAGTDSILTGKGDGLNTISIQGAQDPAGRAMNPDTGWTFFIDTMAPFSTASSPEYSSATSFTVRWSGSDPIPSSGIASYSVFASEDGAPATVWISDTTVTAAVYTGSQSHSYSFYSVATDSAGNQQPAPSSPQCSTSFDFYPPQITGTTVWTDTSFGGPFPVSAQIEDSVGVGLALLWYHTDAETLWQADTMAADKDLYAGAIPEQTEPNTTVMYYIHAQDVAEPANSQTDPLGAPGELYSFTAYVTAIETPPTGELPGQFVLYQNVPNPFNAGTQIQYELPEAGQIRLEVFNILGQKVADLVDEDQSAGTYTVHWDGRDNNGQVLGSGVYLYRLQIENNRPTRKMVFLR